MALKPIYGNMEYRDKNKSFEGNLANYKRDLLLWEQSEAQKEANKIAIQRLDEERAIAQQQREFELERQMAEFEALEEQRKSERIEYEHNLDLEQERQSHEEKMRYYKLCDDMGLDYMDICKINYWCYHPTNNQYEVYEELEEKYKSMVYDEEINNLVKKKDDFLKEAEKFKNDAEEINKKAIVINQDDYIELKGIRETSGESKNAIENRIKKNNIVINYYRTVLFFTSLMTLIFIMLVPSVTIVALLIGGAIDLFALDGVVKYKNGKKIMKEAIANHEKEKEKLSQEVEEFSNRMNNANEQYEQLLQEYNYKIKEREQELSSNKEFMEIKKEHDLLHNDLPNKIEFDNFRKQHYNDDVERLFRRLNINTFTKIKNDEILNKGTIEDYRDFIEEKILNIDDNLYFEDYSSYTNKYFENKSRDDGLDLNAKQRVVAKDEQLEEQSEQLEEVNNSNNSNNTYRYKETSKFEVMFYRILCTIGIIIALLISKNAGFGTIGIVVACLFGLVLVLLILSPEKTIREIKRTITEYVNKNS